MSDRVGLRDIESTLPPGFRFYPSDEELVCHYLYRKVRREVRREEDDGGTTMVEVDLHSREPWELPDVARLNAKEWYFFSFRDRKYATGSRTNRATKSGYWKATGKDRSICDPRTRGMAGMRKTLVFYRGRAPNGMKTPWVMHEFRLETPHSPPKEDWVLCRVFHKRKGEDGADDDVNHNTSDGHGASSASSLAADLAAPPAVPDHEQQQLLPSSSLMGQFNTNNYIGGGSCITPWVDMQTLLHYGGGGGLAHHEFAVPGSVMVQEMTAAAGMRSSSCEDESSPSSFGLWMEMMAAEQLPRWQ